MPQDHAHSHSQDMGYSYRPNDSPYAEQYLYQPPPPPSSHHQQDPQPVQQEMTTQEYVHEWVAGQSQEVQYATQQWPHGMSQTPSPRTGSTPHSRTGSASTSSAFHHQQQQHWPHSTQSSSTYVDPVASADCVNFARTHSPAISSIVDVYGSMTASPTASPATATGNIPEVVAVGSGSTEGGSPVSLTDTHRSAHGHNHSHSHGHGRRSPATSTGTTREQYSGSGRSSGNPPVGISKCASCKVTHSPEWRKGPSGKKDLCNA